MRILKRVDKSVLWLLEDNSFATENLKKVALKSGVDPVRLIFGKRLPLNEHLSRHKNANLFLDTLPYNAHTTASDALWAGLPIVTCVGETFAGRVSRVGSATDPAARSLAFEALVVERDAQIHGCLLGRRNTSALLRS